MWRCHLQTADGQEVTEAAVTDPSHWAVLLVEDNVLVDAVTGEPVDEADIDWSTEHHPERQPAEGARHADTMVEKTVWVPEYYCRDPQACGLHPAEFFTRAQPIVCGQANATTPRRPRPAPKRSAPSGERCWR